MRNGVPIDGIFRFIPECGFRIYQYDFRRLNVNLPLRHTGRREQFLRLTNTGRGWRNILRHCTVRRLAEMVEEHGGHEIFAGGKEAHLADQAQ